VKKKTKRKRAARKVRRDIPDPRTVVQRFEGQLEDGTVTVLRTTQRDEYEATPKKKK
jgi:hypothetical protein